jgi:hypothetical protein
MMRTSAPMRFLPIAAAVVALAPSVSPAQGFVAAGAGQSRFSECVAAGPCDRSDRAYSVRAGYDWNPHFGVETRYAALGESSAHLGTFSNDAGSGAITGFLETRLIGVGFLASARLAPGATVGAFAGAARAESRAGIRSGPGIETFDVLYDGQWHGKTVPYFGARATWELPANFAVGVEAVRYQVDFRGFRNDVDVLSLELLYRFR